MAWVSVAFSNNNWSSYTAITIWTESNVAFFMVRLRTWVLWSIAYDNIYRCDESFSFLEIGNFEAKCSFYLTIIHINNWEYSYAISTYSFNWNTKSNQHQIFIIQPIQKLKRSRLSWHIEYIIDFLTQTNEAFATRRELNTEHET